jgi:hypothetical protein
MYDFIDQNVNSLNRGGQFLIWSMRQWVFAVHKRACPPKVIGPAFAKWGMVNALPQFHAVMTILCHEGLETLYFAPVTCLRISDDEAMMLALFRSLRDNRPDRVRAMAEMLVTEGFAAQLVAGLTVVSMRLADVGLMPEGAA